MPATEFELGSFLHGERRGVEAALNRALDRLLPGLPGALAAPVRLGVTTGGKRLRPILFVSAYRASRGPQRPSGQLYDLAAPLELIHAYSLIHDDLPSMDDDHLRRGRPTLHIAFDEATAVLAGDALQAMAFRTLSRGIQEPAIAMEAVQILASAAGPEALVGGQCEDLAAEHQGPQTLQRLESIHRRKTGALIAASVDLGVLIAGGTRSTRQALANYAKDLGLAFQVVDDLLDFTASESALGKRAAKDAQRGKLTYPGLLGVPEARRKASELVGSARTHLSLLGDRAWRLDKLASYVLERSH